MTTSTPEQDRSSVAAWKKNIGVELPLPSGNVAFVKRPGITTLLAEGVFPDSIVGVITEQINVRSGKAAPKKPQDRRRKVDGSDDSDANFMKEISGDPEKLRAMMIAVDKILALVCIQPPVVVHWKGEDPRTGRIPASERSNDVVYTDEVDENDKMFVFNFAVGGSDDLAAFRAATDAAVGSLSGGEDVALPPK